MDVDILPFCGSRAPDGSRRPWRSAPPGRKEARRSRDNHRRSLNQRGV